MSVSWAESPPYREVNVMTQKQRSRRTAPQPGTISILEAARRFGDPKVAEARLRDQRWPNGMRCRPDNPSTQSIGTAR